MFDHVVAHIVIVAGLTTTHSSPLALECLPLEVSVVKVLVAQDSAALFSVPPSATVAAVCKLYFDSSFTLNVMFHLQMLH